MLEEWEAMDEQRGLYRPASQEDALYEVINEVSNSDTNDFILEEVNGLDPPYEELNELNPVDYEDFEVTFNFDPVGNDEEEEDTDPSFVLGSEGESNATSPIDSNLVSSHTSNVALNVTSDDLNEAFSGSNLATNVDSPHDSNVASPNDSDEMSCVVSPNASNEASPNASNVASPDASNMASSNDSNTASVAAPDGSNVASPNASYSGSPNGSNVASPNATSPSDSLNDFNVLSPNGSDESFSDDSTLIASPNDLSNDLISHDSNLTHSRSFTNLPASPTASSLEANMASCGDLQEIVDVEKEHKNDLDPPSTSQGSWVAIDSVRERPKQSEQATQTMLEDQADEFFNFQFVTSSSSPPRRSYNLRTRSPSMCSSTSVSQDIWHTPPAHTPSFLSSQSASNQAENKPEELEQPTTSTDSTSGNKASKCMKGKKGKAPKKTGLPKKDRGRRQAIAEVSDCFQVYAYGNVCLWKPI